MSLLKFSSASDGHACALMSRHLDLVAMHVRSAVSQRLNRAGLCAAVDGVARELDISGRKAIGSQQRGEVFDLIVR